MFEILSEKLNSVFVGLGRRGRLSEKDVDAALREIRLALLEADVNFRVARDMVANIRESVLTDEVLTNLNPVQKVIKITDKELTKVLGGGVRSLELGDEQPSSILIVGLNGSGKTTTSAKLAMYLKKSGQMPVIVAGDLQRPAAIEQLEILGKQIDVTVCQDRKSKSALDVVRMGLIKASSLNAAWAIVDTAGRFQIDDEMMEELEEIKIAVSPKEILLVVDAMTGQDAVNVATEFHSRLGLTGLVLTKLDGDSRGGAALSIVSATGVPIKFIGTGEKIEALDQFYPDRLSSRILGMGDMLSLIEKAEESFDGTGVAKLQKKIKEASLDLDDFLQQLQQLRNMGPIGQIMEMIPGMSSLKGRMPSDQISEERLTKTEAIIYSMTLEERRNPDIIRGSRRRRIAKGSGTVPQEVNQILNQFRQMQKLIRQVSSGKGLGGFTKMLR